MSRAVVVLVTPATLPYALDHLSRGHPLARAEYAALFEDGTLKPDDVIAVVPEADTQMIVGAILTHPLGGGQASLWPPVADDERVCDALVRNAVKKLHDGGAHVLQVVTTKPPPASIASVERAGFRFASDLVFCERELNAADAQFIPPFELVPVAIDDPAFAETIEKTYVGSLDMPELNGTRTTAELLAGCQHAARTSPPLWWFAKLQNEVLGVIQLALAEQPGEVELLYMGLVPAARRRGVGLSLARAAIALAAKHGTRLALSFDVRNRPAQRVYDQLGFVEKNRRGVWLKIGRD